ncbi:hypothetical protein SCHPADRAFT_938076 [Schizopora paradoxa]|uniref:DUF6533 domain-containing protein n=1 Tax=Schizopora paradoxa TaxID=27342 RepID=A0A0H2SGH4_9AGAM|nr:hypothetical protein SCHPADRAFT_938076 [Schizopora paradoxa]
MSNFGASFTDGGASTTVDQYYILASAVVFLYDFSLTIPQEIMFLWTSKPKLANVLVLSLRYLTALGYIPVLLLIFAPSTRDAMGGLMEVLLAIGTASVYDVQEGISDVTGLGTYQIYTLSASCFASPVETASVVFYALSYFANFSLDALIFFFATKKTWRMHSENKLLDLGSQPSLASILLRDGSILYAILAISNIANFIFYTVCFIGNKIIDTDSFMFAVSSGTNSEMPHALSAILVSRMIFNLREAGTELHESTLEWRSRIQFQSIHQANCRRLRANGRDLEDEFGEDTFNSS